MMHRDVIWWLVFLPTALVIQMLLPGIDVLVVALILMLQERTYKRILWLFPLLVFIQEGIGSFEFGGMVLWYLAAILLFLMGRWLFEVENFLFIFLLAACLGATHFGLVWLLSLLQNMHMYKDVVFDESILQALLIPIVWRIAFVSRKWVGIYEQTA